MERTKDRSVYYFLILGEISTSIGLGVFGNWLADLIRISPTGVLFGSMFMMLLFFFITVQRIQYEKDKENFSLKLSFRKYNSVFANFARELLKRDVTIFPIALTLGLIIGFISTALFPKTEFIILQTRWFGEYRFLSWHDYEAFSYLVVAVTVYFFNWYTKDGILVFAFSIAYTIGLLGTFLLYRPEHNDIVNIAINFVVIIGFTALIRSEAVEGFINDVRALLSRVMRK